MKQQDINDLLSGLLGDQPRPKPAETAVPAPPPEPKRTLASERSRQRVEELLRSVELENSQRKAAEPQKRDMTIPKREPVPVPPPVSHFTDEPSQNPAVRMRDRLDETALPMLDSERKPNQIIPPKPKQEQPKKKRKKKRPAVQNGGQSVLAATDNNSEIQSKSAEPADIPAPAAPKKKIVHINVPDELPPDIPRELPALEETPAQSNSSDIPAPVIPKRRIPHIVVPDELPPDVQQDASEVNEIRQKISEIHAGAADMHEQPAQSEELDEHDQEILRRAERIKAQIRLAMEEIQAVPDTEGTEPEALPVESPVEDAEPEIAEEMPKKSKFGGVFRRKLEEAAVVHEEPAPEEITEPELCIEPEATEEPAPPAEPEVPEVPKSPRLRHLSAVDEPKEKPGLFGFSRKKKQNLTADVTSAASEAEIMEILGEVSEAKSPSEKRNIFKKRSKVELIPEPVEYDDVPEDPADYIHPEEIGISSDSVELPETEETQSSEDAVLIQMSEPMGIGASIRAALDGNAQELADVKAEPLPDDAARSGGRMRTLRRRTYFIAGILCSALALVGIGACVVLGARAIRDFAGSSSLEHVLEDVVYPVAVVDLPDFENAADAAPETLLSAAVIDLLMFGDLSGYSEAFDVISVPAEDVRTRANVMFGTEITGDYETLYAAGELFFYDAATGCYNVPSMPVIFSYAPEITEIRRSDDVYTLTVVYRADTAQWQERSENFSWTGEKTMEITLNKNGDDYQIVRIMNISEHSDGV